MTTVTSPARISPLRHLPKPRRIAVLSVHTSPLDQPGTGDAGGMNVYIVETARRLAEAGIEVEIFTRSTSSALPTTVEMGPGVTVRHVTAGPFEGLLKQDLPGQLCAVTAGVMRAEAARPEGWFDLIHSHYWLSGQVGWLSSERWNVPLVHSMHTMAKVKNLDLAEGDTPEPTMRVIGEEQVVAAADRLIANTDDEAHQLVDLYGADPDAVDVVHPGVDLEVFTPGNRAQARKRRGVPDDAIVLLFVGTHPAAQGPRRPHPRGGRAGCPRSGAAPTPGRGRLRWPLRLRARAAHGARRPGPRAGNRRPRAVRAAERPGNARRLVPSGRRHRRPLVLGVLRPGGGRVPGLRNAGRRRRRRWPAHRGRRPRQRPAGRRARPGDFARAIARITGQPALRDEFSSGAHMHAAAFGWAATTAGLMNSYSAALANSSAQHRFAALNS